MILINNILGVYYILFSLLGSLIGFSFSLVLSIELNSPFTVISEYFYYVSLTSHGVLMVFYFLTLLGTAFYVFLLPNICMLSSMYSVTFSLISVILSTLSLFVLIFSLFVGEFVNTGWTLYFPLSSNVYNDSPCLDFAVFGLLIFTISSIIVSINIMCTVLQSLVNFESLLDVSVFVWSGFLTSLLIVFSTPSLICVLFMLLLDSNFNTYYFDCEFGGSAILFQSMFWFWGHPEVYILIIPVFGIVSDCIFYVCGGFLYNSSGIIFSMLSLTVLSFLVWGHHMVTAGLDLDVNGFFMISTIIISIPTGVNVFSWLYSLFLFGGEFNILSGLLIMFLFTFSFGGITGVFLSNYSLDLVFHDSYFVVGHFHTILAIASLFGYLSGVFNLLSSYSFVSYFIFLNLLLALLSTSLYQLLISFHIKGFLGVPSSVSNYLLDYYFLFYLGGVGTLGVWISLFLFLVLIISVFNVFCSKLI